jgi:hypothetical protein
MLFVDFLFFFGANRGVAPKIARKCTPFLWKSGSKIPNIWLLEYFFVAFRVFF